MFSCDKYLFGDTLRHAGTGLAKNSEGLRRDAHFTVIAFDDENGKATLRVVSDEESAPSSGRAKIRLIDAAGQPGDFDLYFAGRNDRLTGAPMMGAVSGWKEVDHTGTAGDPRTR